MTDDLHNIEAVSTEKYVTPLIIEMEIRSFGILCKSGPDTTETNWGGFI